MLRPVGGPHNNTLIKQQQQHTKQHQANCGFVPENVLELTWMHA